jgi:hypothetical protein
MARRSLILLAAGTLFVAGCFGAGPAPPPPPPRPMSGGWTPSDGPSSQEIDFPALQPDEPQKAHRSLRERLGSLGKVRD